MHVGTKVIQFTYRNLAAEVLVERTHSRSIHKA